ncbi:MAG: asparaginase [Mycobacterium sp.]
MRTVVVITTGGTIASTADNDGVKVATVPGDELVTSAMTPDGVAVRVVDVSSLNSYAMTFDDMDRVHSAVRAALDDSSTCGVVVSHGTDTLEETAMLVDLFHHDPRPVVFTGAQRSCDDAEGDGPRNLRDAIAVAASSTPRNLGVLVCFAGVLHAARGTRKVHNTALEAFFDVDNGPIGIVVDGCVRVHGKLARAETGLVSPVAIAGIRVDTVALYPGADSVAIDALVAAGSRGLVLQATGYGNANRDIAAAVGTHTAGGIPIVLSSRVSAGPIRAVYGGGGGGVDLTAAGAIPAGFLRPSQARILLAAQLAAGADRTQIVRAFHGRAERYTDRADDPSARHSSTTKPPSADQQTQPSVVIPTIRK